MEKSSQPWFHVTLPRTDWQTAHMLIEPMVQHLELQLVPIHFIEPVERPWQNVVIVQAWRIDAETALLLCHRLVPKFVVDVHFGEDAGFSEAVRVQPRSELSWEDMSSDPLAQ